MLLDGQPLAPTQECVVGAVEHSIIMESPDK